MFGLYKVEYAIRHTHENIILMKIEKNIKCLLMEHFSETTAAYEGGTKRSWFSGTCHSTVPTFQECETSTLSWKHLKNEGNFSKT